MKVLLEFEINNCNDCPYITGGRTFGNDGRDGKYVHVCSKGVFGKKNDERDYGYSSGLSKIPENIPENCLLKCNEELNMPNATEASLSITQPMLIKHNYRDIKIAEGTTVTIDLEEIKKEIEKSICKQLGVPGI